MDRRLRFAFSRNSGPALHGFAVACLWGSAELLALVRSRWRVRRRARR